MKIKIPSSIATLAIAMIAITTPYFVVYAKAAESDAPEPGDCPDPTDPLCPPAATSATNQTGNSTTAASPSSSIPNISTTK